MSDTVKCLVWDLDNTLWSGTLLESDRCRLRPGVRGVLLELDRRGVLLSVASCNEPDQALPLLRRKGLDHLFLHPQIGWSSKIRSVQEIAARLDVSLDAMGFIDDEPYEQERMRQMLPQVRVYPAAAYRDLPRRPELNPGVLSEESRSRREKYVQAADREHARVTAGVSHSEFLASAATRLRLRRAVEADLPRILELLQRTHQLNSTGVVHPPDEVERWLHDPRHRVFVAELRDRYVDYGRIGVAVCRCRRGAWELVSFLLSCRVLSRGISGYVLAWVQRQASLAGAASFAGRYRPTGRNQRMENLYRLGGLRRETAAAGGIRIFSGAPRANVRPPRWLTVEEQAP